MGILILVMGVVLSNNRRFGGQLILRSIAYDIALSVRQAQTYGVSVRQTNNTNTTAQFASGYGVHFNTAATEDKTYILFADTYVGSTLITDPEADSLGIWDSVSENVEISTMTGGYKINKITLTEIGDATTECNNISPCRVDISFKRPEPDAFIKKDGLNTLYRRADIELKSPRDNLKNVIVEITGQISVQ
jgi:hypothetical protein